MEIRATFGGIRLSQHGVVISEMRLRPGPTHSVFDVLAGLIAILRPKVRVGILGFAAGGMLAPLRSLGCDVRVEAVDLDAASYDVFQKHCSEWAGDVCWEQADAVAWLSRRRRKYSVLVDDLSVPTAGDVFKPDASWDEIPRLMRQRLGVNGVAIFNCLPGPNGRIPSVFAERLGLFGSALVILLDDFENRVVVAGPGTPSARWVGKELRAALRRLGSSQSDRLQVWSGIQAAGIAEG
jgi:hypothetical protein